MKRQTLTDRWMNDLNFRKAFAADPRAAVRDAGLHASEAELAAMTDITHASGQALQSRIQPVQARTSGGLLRLAPGKPRTRAPGPKPNGYNGLIDD